MLKKDTKYRSCVRSLIFTALLLFCTYAYTQSHQGNDTLIRIAAVKPVNISDRITIFPTDTLIRLQSSIVPSGIYTKDKSIIFFDSLKVRASKNSLTKKIYDIIIVAPDTAIKKQITAKSDENYLNYSGRRIRKILIHRLNVFGSNLYKPAENDPEKTDNLLNKTHVNTNERIIRKNLLFAEGDTISPLTLSDNERILRQLSFIDDARIIVVPVSDGESDILVLTKDVYSLGGSFSYQGLKKGTISVFEKNILGIGHEFGLEVPYNSKATDSPGIGFHYLIDNMWKSFINLNLFYLDGLGEKTYGFNLTRNLISSTTKYAGGISVRQMYTTEDLNNTLPVPQPFRFNFQDYWLSRSILINKESVSRIIIGARYTNNNVYDRPFILPDSYYYLQKYRLYIGSIAYSVQKYYKTNLIYGYGRTEDIPYGGLFRITLGKEHNEFQDFRKRMYMGAEAAFGKSTKALGYFYASAGIASYLDGTQTRQGLLSLNMKYFSNLLTIGDQKIRNFVNIGYTRGFDRNTDEFISINTDNGFTGFKNDSITGTQRLSVSLESVLFSPLNIYDFRFAFFGFTDFAFLCGSNQLLGNGNILTGLGVGIRIRNDNLVFNTFQMRIGFYPNPPLYSKINHFSVSGEQLLSPNNFDSGPPSIIPYR
jgi:hypothetical protein